jgi:hypothetical protein
MTLPWSQSINSIIRHIPSVDDFSAAQEISVVMQPEDSSLQ